MALSGIPFGDGDVVAALDHARAAAFAEQPLHRDGHVEIRRGILRMQCGEQPRTARAEDQHIRASAFDHRGPRGLAGTPQPQSAGAL